MRWGWGGVVQADQTTPGSIGARMSGGGGVQSEVGDQYARHTDRQRGSTGKHGIEQCQRENALPDLRGGGVQPRSGGGSSQAPSQGRRAPDVRLIPEGQSTAPGLPHVTKRSIGSGVHARRTDDVLPCCVFVYYTYTFSLLAMFEERLQGEKGSQNKSWADELYIYICICCLARCASQQSWCHGPASGLMRMRRHPPSIFAGLLQAALADDGAHRRNLHEQKKIKGARPALRDGEKVLISLPHPQRRTRMLIEELAEKEKSSQWPVLRTQTLFLSHERRQTGDPRHVREGREISGENLDEREERGVRGKSFVANHPLLRALHLLLYATW